MNNLVNDECSIIGWIIGICFYKVGERHKEEITKIGKMSQSRFHGIVDI